MVDIVTPEKRSAMMSRIRSKNTKPEMAVRKQIFAAGFRYRLHARNLPGKPDLVLSRYKVAVFVHGCFWHGHECQKGRLPGSNRDFWREKIAKNIKNDQRASKTLKADGWTVVTIWECRLEKGVSRLLTLLESLKKTTAPARDCSGQRTTLPVVP